MEQTSVRCNFLVLFIIISAPLFAQGQPSEGGESGKIRAIMAAIMKESRSTPGASLCVLRRNRPLLRQAAGYKVITPEAKAVKTKDNFRLASISKTFTAALFLKSPKNTVSPLMTCLRQGQEVRLMFPGSLTGKASLFVSFLE